MQKREYGPVDAHIDLPGMNVMVKRSTTDGQYLGKCVPAKLEHRGGTLYVEDPSSRWEKLMYRLDVAAQQRLCVEGFDAVLVLPPSVHRCYWTKKTNVRQQAYEVHFPYAGSPTIIIDLPGWSTVLLPQDEGRQNVVSVYSHHDIGASKPPAKPERQLYIGKGTSHLPEGRLRYIDFAERRAIERAEDGFVATVRIPHGALVRVRGGTPCENGLAPKAATVIVE